MNHSYKERVTPKEFGIFEEKVGYWEELTSDRSGNLWCGEYGSLSIGRGVWYLISPNRKIKSKVFYNDLGGRRYSISWENGLVKYSKPNFKRAIHIQEDFDEYIW